MRTQAIYRWYFCEKLFSKFPKESHIEITGSWSQEKSYKWDIVACK